MSTDPFQNTSKAILGIYWAMFILSIFFCQKIFAIELMFTLQFTYMTLISIGIFSQHFSSLKLLKYSFGWNDIPFSLTQTTISENYTSAGIQSNFLSNLNFMIIIILFCPIVYLCMTKAADYFKHYQTNPRLLIYGKTFLFEIPLTIILLNLPNICLSSIVSLQAFGVSNIISLTLSIFSIIIACSIIVIFILFKQHFRQFRQQFCQRLQICKISIYASSKIKQLYPVLVFLEISLLSIILSIEKLMPMSVFISFGIIIFFSGVILVISPYNFTVDNVRLFVHRMFLVIISGIQIGFSILNTRQIQSSMFVYNYPWIFLIILILVAVGINLPYLVYRSYQWVKKPNLKDLKLYSQQCPRKQRQYYPNKPLLSPHKLYPALQFSIHPSREQRQEVKKKLLQIPKLKKKAFQSTQWENSVLNN